MTVTDPAVPDPLNDPRTLQADPGAHGEGADLASTEDHPDATGEEEIAREQPEAGTDPATGRDPGGVGGGSPGDPRT